MAWPLKPAPLFMNGVEARCGIPGTNWGGLGLGEKTFRRWVKNGTIPSHVDEDTGTRRFRRLELEAWSSGRQGSAA